MAAAPGWYQDPSEPGRQRYFDGARWTDNYYYATTSSPMYSAPPADPALGQSRPGWYPDPQVQARRRYWDGQQWTNHYTEVEIKTPKINPAVAILWGLLALMAVIGSAISDEPDALATTLVFIIMFTLIAGGLFLAFRSDARRKQRQQLQDRNIGLAINADIEDTAYTRGDDQRGVHGQFPPAS
jgi:hypothetical protein